MLGKTNSNKDRGQSNIALENDETKHELNLTSVDGYMKPNLHHYISEQCSFHGCGMSNRKFNPCDYCLMDVFFLFEQKQY